MLVVFSLPEIPFMGYCGPLSHLFKYEVLLPAMLQFASPPLSFLKTMEKPKATQGKGRQKLQNQWMPTAPANGTRGGIS